MGLIKKLNELQIKLSQLDYADIHCQFECGSKVSETEIMELENRLGITLPFSYRHYLSTVGRSVYFYYSLDDCIMPDELHAISWGGLSWDIEALNFIGEMWTEFDNDCDEEEKAYIQSISQLLEFAHAGNGDIYAFDMAAEGAEKPVIYWEHETGEIIMLADSFQSFIDGVIELYAVHENILEWVVDEKGINLSKKYAMQWKNWFEKFLNVRFETEKKDLSKLFAFTLTRKKFTLDIKNAYQGYDKNKIFSLIQDKLLHTSNSDIKKLLIQMICELFQRDAGQWVLSLWSSITDYPHITTTNLTMGEYTFTSDLLAKLSFCCLPEIQAFTLVTDYLKNWASLKLSGHEAFNHLKEAKRKLVLPWIEQQKLNSPYGWDELFLAVRPNWDDLLYWSEEEKKRNIMIDGLYLLIDRNRRIFLQFDFAPPVGLPPQAVVLKWLMQLKEVEFLNSRKKKIAEIASNVELLYS